MMRQREIVEQYLTSLADKIPPTAQEYLSLVGDGAHRIADIEKKVQERLDSTVIVSPSAVAAALGLPGPSVRRVLQELRDEGKAAHLSRGHWALSVRAASAKEWLKAAAIDGQVSRVEGVYSPGDLTRYLPKDDGGAPVVLKHSQKGGGRGGGGSRLVDPFNGRGLSIEEDTGQRMVSVEWRISPKASGPVPVLLHQVNSIYLMADVDSFSDWRRLLSYEGVFAARRTPRGGHLAVRLGFRARREVEEELERQGADWAYFEFAFSDGAQAEALVNEAGAVGPMFVMPRAHRGDKVFVGQVNGLMNQALLQRRDGVIPYGPYIGNVQAIN